MRYLDEMDFSNRTINWSQAADVIEEAVRCVDSGDYAQPVKPYLRYRNPQNRIIAMPAFLGGEFNIAGIKWIASFPDNIYQGIPRAHSVMILNDAETGQPKGIINTAQLSVIRTASVSGVVLRRYIGSTKRKALKICILGFGPIGRQHLEMCETLIGNQVAEYRIFDINPIDITVIPAYCAEKVTVMNSWETAYDGADVVITCTVSKERYIDRIPKKSALLLNVSLRDFMPSVYPEVETGIIVDDWIEVCRENTDIELFHLEKGLEKSQVHTICDVVCRDLLDSYGQDSVLMFNPMGMAVFDLAVSSLFLKQIEKESPAHLQIV